MTSRDLKRLIKRIDRRHDKLRETINNVLMEAIELRGQFEKTIVVVKLAQQKSLERHEP